MSPRSESRQRGRIDGVEPLDNPVWHALCGPHATLAEGSGGARRYRREYTEFAAVVDGTDADAWHALGDLVGPGGFALLVTDDAPPAGWLLVGAFPVRQMVFDREAEPIEAAIASDGNASVQPLDASDAAAMTALIAATEPGPWSTRTHELGEFVGIRVDGRLVAMAGQRMRLPHAVEISAVCTDPAYRGCGYAGVAVTAITARTAASGLLPFLHVRDDNIAAIRVYERLGYRTRRLLRAGLYQAPTP
jgi:ribosomal protein S18 acetylase RimI-like enzyme